MTDEFTYTAEQALARSVLLTAVNGGINHWARVHGFTVDCPPEQVRAEGVDTEDDRSLWHVDLDDTHRTQSDARCWGQAAPAIYRDAPLSA